MDELIRIIIGNSPIIATLVFLVYFLIKDRKETIRRNDEKDTIQNNLEKEFREYLVKQNTDHHIIMTEYHKIMITNQQIIKANTIAYEKFTDIFSKIIVK